MHGRLKVRTTAEQEEAKKKERALKVKKYQAAISRAFEKREKKEYDAEALQITGQLLAGNPDIYTMWNYRREIFTDIRRNAPERVEGLWKEELEFLESCLRVNPKSYGVWHNRSWLLGNMPNPDWKHELYLCNKFLEYDERNFHCWDYRRFVVKMSAIPTEDELEFTSSKINSNFSNYSSWYYRSKLLAKLYPDKEGDGRVVEDVLLKEFELVQNAFFTDPNDQSAWFYHRWLLGKGDRSLAIDCLYVSRETNKLIVRFNKDVKVGCEGVELLVQVNDVAVSDCNFKWINSAPFSPYGTLWVTSLPSSVFSATSSTVVTVSLVSSENSPRKTCVLGADNGHSMDAESSSFRGSEMTLAKTETLTNELEMCKQLEELEPDNKWVMLTIVSLLRAINPVESEREMLGYLEKLKTVDRCRRNYYNDLGSKYVVENALIRQRHLETTCNFSGKALTSLYYTEYFATVTVIDLSCNKLVSLKQCCHLLCAKVLKVDNNEIECLDGLETLAVLEELSVRGNRIKSVKALKPLTNYVKLEKLDLRDNPLCFDNFDRNSADCIRHVRELLI